LGLAAHQMAGFNADRASEVLNIPADFTCMSMIAIGYQASPDIFEDGNKDRDLAARVRKPLEDICFKGQWGTTLS
jgi:hypothetical protein